MHLRMRPLCTAHQLAVRSFTFASMLPGEIAPAVLLPCYATLNTLVAGFLITQNTIPSAMHAVQLCARG
jgi:hypothetical protein